MFYWTLVWNKFIQSNSHYLISYIDIQFLTFSFYGWLPGNYCFISEQLFFFTFAVLLYTTTCPVKLQLALVCLSLYIWNFRHAFFSQKANLSWPKRLWTPLLHFIHRFPALEKTNNNGNQMKQRSAQLYCFQPPLSERWPPSAVEPLSIWVTAAWSYVHLKEYSWLCHYCKISGMYI